MWKYPHKSEGIQETNSSSQVEPRCKKRCGSQGSFPDTCATPSQSPCSTADSVPTSTGGKRVIGAPASPWTHHQMKSVSWRDTSTPMFMKAKVCYQSTWPSVGKYAKHMWFIYEETSKSSQKICIIFGFHSSTKFLRPLDKQWNIIQP